MRDKNGTLTVDAAEKLAIDGLTFIAGDADGLGRFLAATGLGPETLRAAADDPAFLAAVLEFLMSDEDLLLVFVERLRIRPTMIAAARLALARASHDPA